VAVFLGVRPYYQGLFNTGRETYLLPVTWKEDWPVILPTGAEVPHILNIQTCNNSGEQKACLMVRLE